MKEIAYDRAKAVAYAHTWAFGRNPKYYNFDELGGDCTNFISQCLYAGCGVMNYTRDVGWYYISLKKRAAAWSGVEFFHRFLVSNKGAGPYAAELPLEFAEPGDIIQLRFATGASYAHTLCVVSAPSAHPSDILIATHTYDSDYRPLSTYSYEECRLLHVLGARK